MRKIFSRINEKEYFCFLILLFVFVYFIWTFFAQSNICGDLLFHFSRIKFIKSNIINGHLFSPIYYEQIEGYGYGSPLFYGDIFLYPFAFLSIIGLSDDKVVKLAIIVPALISIVNSYYCSKKIFNNEKSAFVFSIIYCFSTYAYCNTFSRYALGEVWASSFIPIIALGFYSIVYSDRKFWLCLPIGMACCLLSHILTSVIVVFILILISVFSLRYFIREPIKIFIIIKSALICTGISAFFVFPMVEQMMSMKFLSTEGMSSVVYGELSNHAVPISQLFNPLVDVNYNTIADIWIPGGVGGIPIVLVILILFVKNEYRLEYIRLVTGGFLILFAVSNLFPWDFLQSIFGIIQFPWRLYTIANLFFAFASAYFISTNNSNKYILIFFIVAMLSLGFYSAGYYKKMVYDVNKNEKLSLDSTLYVGTGEYLPAVYDDNGEIINYQTLIDNVLDRDKYSSNNLSMNDIYVSYENHDIQIFYNNNYYNNTYIDVPRILYKGYTAFDTNTHEKLKISQGEYGTVRINLNNIQGTVVLKYQNTLMRVISIVISILAIVVFAIREIVIKLNRSSIL